MKRLLSPLLALLCTAALTATALAEPVAVGSDITVKKPVKISKLAKNPDKFVGKVIRIEGTAKAVCQGAGCWVEVSDAKGVTFLAKSLDESVLLPKDSAGRSIVVQGVVTKMTAKAHDHEHEGEGHACPVPTYLISTQGALLP
jgi:Domain of unknown function (DUF4920)